MSDIDTGVVDSLKVLDPDGRLEKRTNALQQIIPLFDHLVGECEQLVGNIEAGFLKLARMDD